MINITSLLAKAGIGVGFSFGVRAWTEVEIWRIKGMRIGSQLKIIRGLKGFINFTNLPHNILHYSFELAIIIPT